MYELKAPSQEVKSSNVSFSDHGGNYFVKDNDRVGGIKAVEKGPSKSFRVSSVCSRREADSQGGCEDRTHHRIPVKKVKKPLLSEHEQKIQKIFGRARKLSRNEKHCNAKTREVVRGKSISEKLLLQEKGRLVKDWCAKRLCNEAEASPASSLSKDTTSRTIIIKNASPVKSAQPKSATSESPKQPAWSVDATKFKIPKMVHHGKAENRAESSSSRSSGRNRQHAKELFKFATVHQSDTHCDGGQMFSCDRRNDRSSSTSHLPDVSNTVTHPWQDEVIDVTFLTRLGSYDTILWAHI